MNSKPSAPIAATTRLGTPHRSRSHGARAVLVGMLTGVLALAGLAMAVVATGQPSAVAANYNVDFTGTWDATSGGWIITSQDADGNCTGTSDYSGYGFENCHVSGASYSFDVTYGSSYRSHNTGTISGNDISDGNFNDGSGDHHYTAHRSSGGPSDTVSPTGTATPTPTPTQSASPSSTTGATSTGTSLNCDYYFDVQRDACTFTTAGQKSPPTGTVHVTSSGAGTPAALDCSLTKASSGSTLSLCSFQFTPGATATTLTGAYRGDAQNAPASATYTICNNPATGLASCDPDPGVVAACAAFYLQTCKGIVPPPDPLQVCVAAFQNCNGFGGGHASSPGTIDMSGLRQTVTTPIGCDDGSRGNSRQAARRAGDGPSNADLKCQIRATITSYGKDGVAGAAVQYEANYQEFLAAVQQDQAVLAGSIFQFCRLEGSGAPLNICQVLAAIGVTLNRANARFHTAWATRGTPITTDEGGKLFNADLVCNQSFEFPDSKEEKSCIAFVTGFDDSLIAARLKLSALKHALRVDEPGPSDKSQRQHEAGELEGAVPGRARSHPHIHTIAVGHRTLAEGRRGKLKLRFSRGMLLALKRARQHGVTKIRVKLTVTVADRVTTSRTVRLPLELYLTHPPRTR